MCDLMCGGVEEDDLSFKDWWDSLDDIEREEYYTMIMEEN